MSEYLIQKETLDGIADAIIEKTGGTEQVAVPDMRSQILGLYGKNDVEAVTVEPDFSAGDYVVAPSAEGKVFGQVTVAKPENLLPENIKADEVVAGIVGTLVAASGSGGKWAWGTFTGNNAPITINHNLGVVPDLVIVKVGSPSTLESQGLYEIVAFLEAKEALDVLGGGKYGWALAAQYGYLSSYITSFMLQKSLTTPIDSANGEPINNANETSFTVGMTETRLYPANGVYNWIAIGGLT